MSAASARPSVMFGIFGCGSRRKNSIFAGSKFGRPAMEANGGRVGGRRLLIGRDQVATRAPALGEDFALVGIGRKAGGCRKACDEDQMTQADPMQIFAHVA